MSSAEEIRVDADDKRKRRIKRKNAKMMLEETSKSEDHNELSDMAPQGEGNLDANGRGGQSSNKRKKKSLKGNQEQFLDESICERVVLSGNNEGEESDGGKNREKTSDEVAEGADDINLQENLSSEINDKKMAKKNKRKERLMKEASQADKRGICYLSRIPPHMDHVKLRQILSQYGEIKRIYLAPEDPAAQLKRKRGGGFRGQEFLEGWVEFTKKTVAKRVANMLNGEQIGGRKRSPWYYDLWNIKYLSKFKWDDLTEEIAHKNAIREQKLAMELSAAKRERDFYLSKVDKSRALAAIEERHRKKQKLGQDLGENFGGTVMQLPPKVIRQFPQKQPVMEATKETKSQLSRDVLSRVFGAS